MSQHPWVDARHLESDQGLDEAGNFGEASGEILPSVGGAVFGKVGRELKGGDPFEEGKWLSSELSEDAGVGSVESLQCRVNLCSVSCWSLERNIIDASRWQRERPVMTRDVRCLSPLHKGANARGACPRK